MPAAQVELYYLDKSLKRIIDVRKRKHVLRMCHEADASVSLLLRD